MTRIVAVCALLTAGAIACSPDDGGANSRKAAPRSGEIVDGTQVSGTAPPGAFIRLEPLVARDFPPPDPGGFIDQSGQMFVPGALVARAGQSVQFRSSEDILHNVRVIRAEDKAPIFNVATPPWGSYTHKFDEPGTYDVTCDIHTAMRATILVTTTPYATIADENGGFEFADVIPGSYKLIGFSGEHAIERVLRISGRRTEVKLP